MRVWCRCAQANTECGRPAAPPPRRRCRRRRRLVLHKRRHVVRQHEALAVGGAAIPRAPYRRSLSMRSTSRLHQRPRRAVELRRVARRRNRRGGRRAAPREARYHGDAARHAREGVGERALPPPPLPRRRLVARQPRVEGREEPVRSGRPIARSGDATERAVEMSILRRCTGCARGLGARTCAAPVLRKQRLQRAVEALVHVNARPRHQRRRRRRPSPSSAHLGEPLGGRFVDDYFRRRRTRPSSRGVATATASRGAALGARRRTRPSRRLARGGALCRRRLGPPVDGGRRRRRRAAQCAAAASRRAACWRGTPSGGAGSAPDGVGDTHSIAPRHGVWTTRGCTCAEVSSGGARLKLRNPWGQTEWRRGYGDADMARPANARLRKNLNLGQERRWRLLHVV